MRVVLTAFEAKPAAGTEAGLAWNWGRAYRDLGHQVHLLTQAGALTPADDAVWRAEGISVVPVGAAEYTEAPHGAREMVRNFRRYGRWLRGVDAWLRTAADMDVVHHLSLSSARLPWPEPRAHATLVVGPVGGAHLPPLRGVRAPDLVGESLRALSVPVLGVARRRDVRRAGSPDVLFSTNRQTTQFARRTGVGRVEEMLTDGIPDDLVAEHPRDRSSSPRLLWAGRMVGTKRPDLAIRVHAALRASGIDSRLTMAGAGVERDDLAVLAERLGVSAFTRFPGRLSWTDLLAEYDATDLYLFTSMRDSSCPGVVEAAARGVPTVAVRHQGVGTLVPTPVASGPATVSSTGRLTADLTDAALDLLQCAPSAYRARSAACLDFAAAQTWRRKAARVLDLTARARAT